jgi:hypothetical protein
MSSTEFVIVAAVAVVATALAITGLFLVRHFRLRRHFGPEYRRLAKQKGTVSAEKTLRERQRRHAQLTLRDLDQATRDRYRGEWKEVQARFVDVPEEAIGAAQELVTELAATLGYPTDDHDEQVAQLSVEHAETLQRYRAARGVYLRHQRGETTTEELREALVDYRALFADLLGEEPLESVDEPREATADAAHRGKENR